MEHFHGLKPIACLAAVFACTLWSSMSAAGERAQVDLSVSVSMTPATFEPGSHGTFTVTVQNAGPDAAGAGSSGIGGLVVFGPDFIVTTQPPPFELVAPLEGECWIERAVTEPLPDGNIGLIFIYYFGAIPADESRSCSSGIQFYTSTRSSFSTEWSLDGFPNDVDINPANDEIEYVFRLRPTSVPTISVFAMILLGLCLAGAAGLAGTRAVQLRPTRGIG